MNRRELILGAATLFAAATSSKAFAGEHDKMEMPMSGDMSHHHHHQTARNDKLLAAVSDCILKANICLQHCIVLMGQGDKDMAACAKSSSQVLALCNALQQLAAGESKYLPQLAKVAMDVCKECEDECKKTDKHPECKACGESCAACYKECKAIAV